MKKEVYLVEGMSCSGCERAVQKRISLLKGVSHVKANHQRATLALEYEPHEVNLDEIRQALSTIGYKIVGQQPPRDEKPGCDDAVS